MKRIISIILCIFVLMLPFSVLLVSADSVMKITCDSILAKVGDTVMVNLRTENNPGFMVLNLAILYDKENLELTNIENKLSGFVMSTDSAIVWDGSKDYVQDGILATLTFKVKETASDGDYEIKVRFFEASNYDGDDVVANTNPGIITVQSETPIVPTADDPDFPETDDMIIYTKNITAKKGDSVSVDLCIKQNPGFMALNLAIIYDKDNLELTNIENRLLEFVMSTDSAIVWDGSNDYTEDGVLATLTFKVKETANDGDYEIKTKFFEASNYNGDDVVATAVSGKIRVEQVEIIVGDGNGDGKIDAQDLIVLRKALLTDTEYSEILDANGDGVVDIRDLVRMKKHLAYGTLLGKQNTPTPIF